MSSLAVQKLSVDLAGRRVITDVDFSAMPGELVGVIGANGVGKSTLLRALAGLIPNVNGTVLWNDQPVTSLTALARAKAMAYLPQGQSFHWAVSVRHVVALGRLPHLGPLSRMTQRDEDAIEDAMVRAEIVDLADRVATELSGGERSRVLLARALAVGAPILLADEPTAALDPYHQLHTMELLKGLATEGKLVVAVLHDLSLAARFCDRLLLLHNGRIIADGSPDNVLTREHLKLAYKVEAYQSQFNDQQFFLPWKRVG